MATITLTAPQTAADPGRVLTTDCYDNVILHADGLAGAEEVLVFIMGGATRIAYPGPATAQARLTATTSSISLPPGPTYSIDKPLTAGACGVYVSYAPKN